MDAFQHKRTGRARRAVDAVLRTDRRVLAALLVATVLLRLPFVWSPLGIDEGGYSYVASRWLDASGSIYGDQWVDRPPLLIAGYVLANALGGAWALRVLGILAACIVVLASASIAGRAAGSTALRWSGLVATVLTSSAMLQGQTVNAELPAIAFTAGSAWLVVRALDARARDALLLSIAAGFVALCAMLVKQSFVDGFAFASGAMLVVALVGGAAGRRRAGVLLVGGVLGGGAAASLVVAWAELRGPGTRALLDALYGFRVDAGRVLESSNGAELQRLWLLAGVVVLSGLLVLLVAALVGSVRIVAGRQRIDERLDPLLVRATAGGVLAMGAVGLMGVLGGGSWWTHYLLQLVPAIAVGTGIVVAAGPGPARSRISRIATRSGVGAAAATVAACVVAGSMTAAGEVQRRPVVVGDWLAQASRTGDTTIVFWGHANVLQRSGMTTPYPMTWSLPIRVRDPQLSSLRSVLGGPHAPTWVVRWNSLDSWHIDHDHRLRDLIDERYRQVATICGVPVLRLRSIDRADQLPATPDAAACGTATGDSAGTLDALR
ncbi:MAG: hypothetical protein KDC46_03685 [Thermoleophilia bacterium]|nr:hypothetical protein [Thermoleophilia bacterium]